MKLQFYRNMSLFLRLPKTFRKHSYVGVTVLFNATMSAFNEKFCCGCRGQLYCSLTCQVMQEKLDTVKKHMSGKRFAAAKGIKPPCAEE